ncbi:MAG: Na/Pi cotransporter family protein [Syntrophorhabdaceae bacterium]|nr:Na/Pi cotransporter family protein [Syntrophorhabdaceae bacterium]
MFNNILLFITGLVLFLFGMIKLSELMQQQLSGSIRDYLKISVARPIYGFFMGIVSTLLLQSSSATTLLTMGVVSAGLISFYHSLGIILGADIGTTLTAQLVVWKFTTISPFIILAGGILMFTGKERQRSIGEAIFYFGLIFFGLNITSEATAPLKNNQAFIRFFQEVKNPLIGVGIGAVFTGIVQASAIPVGIMVIMGQQGLISIENAVPIVFGANIGTTVTALLGSLVLNINAKRSAISHLLFKVIGVIFALVFFPFFIDLIKTLSSQVSQQVAFSHFFLNLLVALIFGFFLKPFSYIMEKIIPGKDETLPLWPEYLNKRCLNNADDALECVRKELVREIVLARKMLIDSLGLINNFKSAKRKDLGYIEMVIDNLQAEITKYLWNISCSQLSPELSKRLFAFSSIVYDIERMGDHSTNIVELSESKHIRRAIFSEPALIEIKEIGRLVIQTVDLTSSVIEDKNRVNLDVIIDMTAKIDHLIKDAIDRHLQRFYQRICRAEAGPIFVDMLVNLEGISRHCRIIAGQLKGLEVYP